MAKALALCITDLDVGGAEQCLVELALRVDRTRYLPTVYCIRPLPDENRLLSQLKNADVAVCSLNAKRTKQFFSAVRRLANELASRKTEVVQTFLFHANFIGRWAAWKSGVPKVFCGIRVAEPDRRWRHWLDRCTDQLVTRHVCVSRDVADFAARRMRLPREKIVTIPNGVDAVRFRNLLPACVEELGLDPKHRRVIFVGRLEPQKRVAWLIRSAAYWLPRLDDVDLLIVGAGRERTALAALAKQLGLANRIVFAGWRPDVAELLQASSLLVLASAYEGLPNVVLEAMATGLPVVATDVHGLREALGMAADEQLVPVDDMAAFAGQIERILSDRQLADHLGQGNLLRAESALRLDAMVEAYQALWDQS